MQSFTNKHNQLKRDPSTTKTTGKISKQLDKIKTTFDSHKIMQEK